MGLAGHTVVFGGSFNPPHVAHQMACLYLLEALEADAIWLVPAYVHPFGKALTPFEHRVAMCERLVEPFGEAARVDRVEEQLEHQGRTFETLRALRDRDPARQFALAVGADILEEAHRWYRWSDIERMVKIVVLARAGYEREATTPMALPEVSSTLVRERLLRAESVDGLLPTSVIRYVREHGLYSAKPKIVIAR